MMIISIIMSSLAFVAMILVLGLMIKERNTDAAQGYGIAILWFLVLMLEKYTGS